MRHLEAWSQSLLKSGRCLQTKQKLKKKRRMEKSQSLLKSGRCLREAWFESSEAQYSESQSLLKSGRCLLEEDFPAMACDRSSRNPFLNQVVVFKRPRKK